jgi:hypothetical protein
MKFKVTIESVRVETLLQIYEADSLLEALDKARADCEALNRPPVNPKKFKENFHVTKIDEDKS